MVDSIISLSSALLMLSLSVGLFLLALLSLYEVVVFLVRKVRQHK